MGPYDVAYRRLRREAREPYTSMWPPLVEFRGLSCTDTTTYCAVLLVGTYVVPGQCDQTKVQGARIILLPHSLYTVPEEDNGLAVKRISLACLPPPTW
jgi:hypothetical protein